MSYNSQLKYSILIVMIKMAACFSRQKPRTPKFEPFQRMKGDEVQKLSEKYLFPELIKHEDILYEEVLYGNKCLITGVTDNNYESSIFTSEAVKMFNPKHIILGGYPDTAWRMAAGITTSCDRLPLYEAKKMFCRQVLPSGLHSKLQLDPCYYFDEKNRVFWTIDHQDRRLLCDSYWSAAYETMFTDNCKLSYGQPSDIIVFEDLILSYSLQELRDLFHKCITAIHKTYPLETDHRAQLILQLIRHYAMTNQPKLYSKQVTFTTALANQHVKLDNKVLLAVPNCFVRRVAENIHHVTVRPESLYRNYLEDANSLLGESYHRILGEERVEEVLEKFVLLTVLKAPSLNHFFSNGENVFEKSVFKTLFQSLEFTQIQQRMSRYSRQYAKEIFKAHNRWIEVLIDLLQNRTQHLHPKSSFMTLEQQLSKLDERKPNYPYWFKPYNYAIAAEERENLFLLREKMKEIVDYEFTQDQKEIFQLFEKGYRNKESLILFTKLVGKANAKLDLKVKLPFAYYGAFRGIFKEQFRDHILKLEKTDQKSQRVEKQLKRAQKLASQKIREVINPDEIGDLLAGKVAGAKVIDLTEDQEIPEDFEGSQKEYRELLKELDLDMEQLQKIHKEGDENDDFVQ